MAPTPPGIERLILQATAASGPGAASAATAPEVASLRGAATNAATATKGARGPLRLLVLRRHGEQGGLLRRYYATTPASGARGLQLRFTASSSQVLIAEGSWLVLLLVPATAVYRGCGATTAAGCFLLLQGDDGSCCCGVPLAPAAAVLLVLAAAWCFWFVLLLIPAASCSRCC